MINLPRQDKSEIQVFTSDQQIQLIRTSYAHRYGVFIRLTLCTGLRIGELLGLKWEDIDFNGNSLTVRRTLNRLNAVDKNDPNKTEIVIDTPKSQNSRRRIPLPPNAMEDIKRWRLTQQNDEAAAGSAYERTGFVVTNELGLYIEPRTFKDYYNRMLDDAGMGHFTFHALRHTFATRGLEKGMDPKTLSTILGHFSVGFTLDTYAHCLDEQKRKAMDLMNDIYDVGEINCNKTYSYPVAVTPLNNKFLFTSPDFPKCSYNADSIDDGIKIAKDVIEKSLRTYKYPPVPTRNEDIPLQAGGFLIMVSG